MPTLRARITNMASRDDVQNVEVVYNAAESMPDYVTVLVDDARLTPEHGLDGGVSLAIETLETRLSYEIAQRSG